jgi:hypothetical protein
MRNDSAPRGRPLRRPTPALAVPLAVCLAALAAFTPVGAPAPEGATRPGSANKPDPTAARPVLADHLLVTWYGNPRTGRMGILGRHTGDALAKGLRKQADQYARVSGKKVIAAYHLVAVIAQGNAWTDGTWRRRETRETIQSVLDQARANNFKLILDIQRGRSTNRAELEYLRPYLEQPDVYLALDPEFAMAEGEIPGRKIGRMDAAEVNEAINFLEGIIRERKLPPKVLIVHQFTMNMLQGKKSIRSSPIVDVVLDVDGFGDRPLKRAMYGTIMRQQLPYAGIKLFYKEDTNLMSAEDVMQLRPEPAVIIYQ